LNVRLRAFALESCSPPERELFFIHISSVIFFVKKKGLISMFRRNHSNNQLTPSQNFLRDAVSALLASFSVFASAQEPLPYDTPIPVAKVTAYEPTGLPSQFFFIIDQPVANCAAGEWIIWNGGLVFQGSSADPDYQNDRKANVKAVSNSVLAALHTGGRMRVYAKNKSVGVTNCAVKYIHALPAQ
jgi:hypothetical protein